MDFMDILKKFVINNFLFGDDGTLRPNTSLLDEGIIGSMGVLELTAFLEETFNIIIEDHEIIPENLGTLLKIESYLKLKKDSGIKKAV